STGLSIRWLRVRVPSPSPLRTSRNHLRARSAGFRRFGGESGSGRQGDDGPRWRGTAMSNLLAARGLMAGARAFHLLFAASRMAMPLLMALAEWRWLRTADPVWLELCKRWAKGVAILFAVGAVSGTVLSFQLGLLWPGFIRQAGPVIGLPFAMEGFA